MALPGTPMGDLFPLGGAMGRVQRRASPQVVSPNGLDNPPIRARSVTPARRGYCQENPYPQQQRPPLEPVGRAVHMVGQFIQVRRGDEETTVARITYELEESTAVREAHYRAEYEQAAQQLSAELSMQTAQNLQYLEAEQRIYAQARVQTVEAGLATEYNQAQTNLQNAYLRQVQEVNEQLTQGEAQHQAPIHNFRIKLWYTRIAS